MALLINSKSNLKTNENNFNQFKLMENKLFRNLMFTAANVKCTEMPETCSYIHFETCDIFVLKIFDDKDYVPVSKVLWVTDVHKGKIVDWMICNEKTKSQMSAIKHSASVYSKLNNLCDCFNQRSISCTNGSLRNVKSLDQIKKSSDKASNSPSPDTITKTDDPATKLEMQLVGYKASFEAEQLSSLPRDFYNVKGIMSEQAVVVTKKVGNKWSNICSVNEIWSELTGYTQADTLGKSISSMLLLEKETDSKVSCAISDSVNKGYDVSALVIGLKKNGSSFISRIRVVPLTFSNSPLENSSECSVGYELSQCSSRAKTSNFELFLTDNNSDEYFLATFNVVN